MNNGSFIATNANRLCSEIRGDNRACSAVGVHFKENGSAYYWTRVIIVSTVSILIVLSNILNIYILTAECHIPKISRIFLSSLSVSDLSVGLISCLPTIYSVVTEYWPYGTVWCQIAGVFHGTSCSISIWSICMVSIDRYLAICKPLSYIAWKSKRKAYIIIGFYLIWERAVHSVCRECLS